MNNNSENEVNTSNQNKQDFKNRIRYKNPEQQAIHEQMFHLMDEYKKNNSIDNREFLCYLTASIYLTYKKLFPQLSIYIPFRTKSDLSFIQNIQKEFSEYIHDIDDTGPFDETSVTKDISGIKIILDDINPSRPAQGESELILSDPEIQKLSPNYKENPEDISHNEFIEQVHEYLTSPIYDGKEYYTLKKELLGRILKTTPSEFTQERDPKPSFAKLYEDAKHQYDYFERNDNFPSKIKENELTELKDLLDDFRSRSNDQYHFAILNKTIPIVLDDPLIKNALMTSFEFEKETKKPTGFQALYYKLHTPFGLIETQAQSNKANYAATKGSAYHSKLQNKFVNVKNFFELVNPNDEHELSYYLDRLDTVSADELVSEFKNEKERMEFMNSPKGKKFVKSEKYREMMKHIRIKSKMYIPPETGEGPSYEINANDYLFSTAIALSPYMNVCSSGHTSFTNAQIHHKKVIGEFAEVLRTKDSNTCLRELLIRRLEQLIDNDGVLDKDTEEPKEMSQMRKDSLKIAKEHEETSLKLPKDISKKNILNYAEKLRTKMEIER